VGLGFQSISDHSHSRLESHGWSDDGAACPDLRTHLAIIRTYVEVGFDPIPLRRPVPDQAVFRDFFEKILKGRMDQFG
jgi:hypothetical protein